MAAALALGAYPAVAGGGRPLLLGLGLAAAGLQLLGVVRGVAGPLAWSSGTLLAAFALALVLPGPGRGLGAAAPPYGAGMLLAAELGFWAVDLRNGREPAELTRRRGAALAGLAAAALAAAGATLLAGRLLQAAPGLLARAAGVVAAVAILAVLAVLARRAAGAQHPTAGRPPRSSAARPPRSPDGTGPA